MNTDDDGGAFNGDAGRGDFDRTMREQYRLAAERLTPALLGRLRAARRTALAGGVAPHRQRHGLRLFAMPVAALAVAAFALAIGVRMHGQEARTTPDVPRVASSEQASATASDRLASEEKTPVLMLEEDPDFYLWLGEDPLPAALEQTHEDQT